MLKRKMSLFLVLLFLLFPLLVAFTYESHINPKVFDKWQIIDVIVLSPFVAEVKLKNPDPTSFVKRATILVLVSDRFSLLSYSYVLDEMLFSYSFDRETDCYKLIDTKKVEENKLR